MDLLALSDTGLFLPLHPCLTTGLHFGAVALHSLFLYLDMPPPHPSSSRLAQTSFEPNLYLYNYPDNLVPVMLLVHTTYEDGTDKVF